MNVERVAAIREMVAEASDDETDEEFCASFQLAGEDEPWVQVVPGALNLQWPWEDDDPTARLHGALPDLPDDVELVSYEAGLYATFALELPTVDDWAALVERLFLELYVVSEDYGFDAEVYAIGEGDDE